MRIASLLAAGTEMLFGLSLGDSVVAISHECDHPIEALSRPRATRSRIDATLKSREIDTLVHTQLETNQAMYEVDAELLARLQPDLIITQAQCDVCAVSEHEVRSIVDTARWGKDTRVVALNPMALSDVFHDIQRVADAAGVPERGAAYVRSLEARVESIRRHSAEVPNHERPRVVCIEWTDPIMVAANWVPELIEIAGGTCGLTQPGRHSTYTKWDEILAYDPAVIVTTPCGFDLARTLEEMESLRQRDGWGGLTAVATERVYAVDGNAYFNRSGPRLVESLELLAHLIHPTRFPNTAGGNTWQTYPS